ncbi:MAG: hypothetical protein LBT00_06590, partial [Spirochaetaceae bacterium]|nr:hypothetical protein [Spirochaetaceae bacterium]
GVAIAPPSGFGTPRSATPPTAPSPTFGLGRKPTVCLLAQPKRRKQPERYVKYGLKYSEYNDKILVTYLTKNQIFEIIEKQGEIK